MKRLIVSIVVSTLIVRLVPIVISIVSVVVIVLLIAIVVAVLIVAASLLRLFPAAARLRLSVLATVAFRTQLGHQLLFLVIHVSVAATPVVVPLISAVSCRFAFTSVVRSASVVAAMISIIVVVVTVSSDVWKDGVLGPVSLVRNATSSVGRLSTAVGRLRIAVLYEHNKFSTFC